MAPICPDCKRNGFDRIHDNSKNECPFDWPGIREKERQAREKAKGLPKCLDCGSPLWFDQPGRHHCCGGATR
jgi:hypothetical protein